MTRRSARARARRRGKTVAGLVLMTAALFSIGALASAAAIFRTPPYDPQTLCLSGSPPPAHTLILVDATDQLDIRHLRRFATVVADEKRRLPRWGRLTVASLDPDAATAPRILFSACTPGDRTSANPLWENVKSLESAKAAHFDAPLEATLKQANRRKAGAGSPIVEGLFAAASETEFALAPRRRLVLVSDLLQHGPSFSLYRDGADFAAYLRSPTALRRPPDLSTAHVRVVLLERADQGAAQDLARSAFWPAYFSAAGAPEVAFDR